MSEEFQCRICLEDGLRTDFIAPCACRGTQKWVHRQCLNKWRSTREDKAFSKCTECHYNYELICVVKDNASSYYWRLFRFISYVLRDFFGFLLLTQLLVALFGILAYACDGKSHSIIKFVNWGGHDYLIYYMMGNLITLSLIGFVFMLSQTGLFSTADICSNLTCYPYYPIYIGQTNSTGCECCCCSEINCAEGCGSQGECCCCCSSEASIGHEVFLLFLVLIVIFAIIGLIVSIILGIYFIQYVVRKHLLVLDKWNLTKDYIVRDLAENEEVTSEIEMNSMKQDTSNINYTNSFTSSAIDSPVYLSIPSSSMHDNTSNEPSQTHMTRNQRELLIDRGLF